MKFLKTLIIQCIGSCKYIEEKGGLGYFYIPQDNHSLLDVMNMFHSMGVAFDYEKVTEVIPFSRRNDYFKLSNFRRIDAGNVLE